MSTKKKPNSKGNISIAWCDNGMVDGLFANALISTVLHKDEYGLPITGVLQVRVTKLLNNVNSYLMIGTPPNMSGYYGLIQM
jgi:hypothetical protein